jgi:hypothetical protein
LILHAIRVGDSLLVIALVHKKAEEWLSAVQFFGNEEIVSSDLNKVLSALQNEIANELNRDLPAVDATTP